MSTLEIVISLFTHNNLGSVSDKRIQHYAIIALKNNLYNTQHEVCVQKRKNANVRVHCHMTEDASSNNDFPGSTHATYQAHGPAGSSGRECIATWPRCKPNETPVDCVFDRQSVTIGALIMDLRSRGFFRRHWSCE